MHTIDESGDWDFSEGPLCQEKLPTRGLFALVLEEGFTKVGTTRARPLMGHV